MKLILTLNVEGNFFGHYDPTTFYRWKKVYPGIGIVEFQRLKERG